MRPNPKPAVWWVETASWWTPSFPSSAYPLISEADALYRRRAYFRSRGTLFGEWWCVPVVEHNWDHPGEFAGLDLGEVHRELGMTPERVFIMALEARVDATTHPIREMRALYERCAMYLDAMADHLARTA